MRKNKTNKPVKKRKMKKKIIAAVCIVLALVIIIVPTVIFRNKKADFKVSAAIVKSYEVVKGNVSTTISATGTLANAEAEPVKISEGIKIKKVYVKEGDAVTKGQELALIDKASAAQLILDIAENIDGLSDELSDVDSSDDKTSEEYMKRLILKNRINDLKDEKKKLMKIYKTGKITAAVSGIIDTVNISDNATVSEQNSENTSGTAMGSMLSSDVKGTSGITLLSYGESDNNAESLSEEMNSTSVTLITNADMSALNVAVPKTGEAPQTEIAETHFYTGKISWDSTGNFEAGKTYTATIILTAKEGYAFAAADSYNILSDSEVCSKEVSLNKEIGVSKNELGIKVVYMTEAANKPTASPATPQPEKQSKLQQASENETKTVKETQQSTTGNKITDAVSSSSVLSSSTKSSENITEGNSDSSIEISQVEIFTIAPSDSMVLSVSVDELDINSVACGQNAVITMDAFENKEFSGIINNVGTTATTSGGSSKYTVDIILNKEEGMLQGMSASAIININEANDVILIPSDAISERGGASFVYTGKTDEGQLTDEIQIQTGLSDGTNVEVTEGLSEGDTVYYTVINSQNGTDSMGGFGMPGMGGGMNFNGKMNPGDFSHDMGGGMPQGGPQGERQSDGQGGGKNWRQ
jgi:hypothetical protein